MSSWLTAKNFSNYPPEGKALAISHLPALRQIPASLLPVFLVDLKAYDWKFPIEQKEVIRRIEFVGTHPSSLTAFRSIVVPPSLDDPAKAVDPQRYLAEMTAYLWSSLQMDAYRSAADQFVNLLDAASAQAHLELSRLVVICLGQDAAAPTEPLFHKLRDLGQIRSNVHYEGAADAILAILRRRSQSHPGPYTHWYVDGGNPISGFPVEGVTQVSYPALAPVNKQILARMRSCIEAGTGPEVLERELAEISEQNVSLEQPFADPRLRHFAVSLLAEGSGTQIFSTSFVQWAAREVLRRAQPATLLVRFAPRQRQRPFNVMVENAAVATDLDPEGSLIDADMAAYYTYLELMRLPDAENAKLVVWFENHAQAFVAGRGVPVKTVSDLPITLADLLAQVSDNI
jgi:hypothetical protein